MRRLILALAGLGGALLVGCDSEGSPEPGVVIVVVLDGVDKGPSSAATVASLAEQRVKDDLEFRGQPVEVTVCAAGSADDVADCLDSIKAVAIVTTTSRSTEWATASLPANQIPVVGPASSGATNVIPVAHSDDTLARKLAFELAEQPSCNGTVGTVGPATTAGTALAATVEQSLTANGGGYLGHLDGPTGQCVVYTGSPAEFSSDVDMLAGPVTPAVLGLIESTYTAATRAVLTAGNLNALVASSYLPLEEVGATVELHELIQKARQAEPDFVVDPQAITAHVALLLLANNQDLLDPGGDPQLAPTGPGNIGFGVTVDLDGRRIASDVHFWAVPVS